ncbi:hypothetical protein BJY04DRAFT_212623 [Aspergillus karnatakaensis]|uniref:uncharacterized protein n=1 Tax=Aspergillus karnatakaensis TaxID=1810916 RepID=UPI003CCD7D83
MTYKPPQVEEGQDTDDVTNSSKRKRNTEKTPTTQENSAEESDLEPPSKAAKADEDEKQEETPALEDDLGDDDEDGIFEDDGEFDEGDLAEDKDAVDNEGEDEDEEEEEDTTQKKRSTSSPSAEKLQKTIEKFGRGPLQGTAIEKEALTGSPETVFAMLMDAMLKSKPMSHELTDKALRKLVDVGYHDIRKLGDASWEERAMVLKDGGYNRYREQGSTNLGKLVEFVSEKYDGDLNNLVKQAGNDPQKTRELVKEVHGLGDLGVELFFNNVQSVWPSIAPFVDSRSLQTAEESGLGTDLDSIYADLDKDSVRMCKLANALSAARLDRRVGDLMAI